MGTGRIDKKFVIKELEECSLESKKRDKSWSQSKAIWKVWLWSISNEDKGGTNMKLILKKMVEIESQAKDDH